LFAFVAFFFRDPSRHVPSDAGLVSPGDGRVTEVAPISGNGGTRISIFLSLFDVHINRSPAAGRIERIEYRPGRFLPANLPHSALANEQNEIRLATRWGEVRFTQIAGVIARRIVCWKREGDTVAAGDKIGLIQFGSRVEVVLPPALEPLVSVGTRVKGGSSVLAREKTMPADREEKSHAAAIHG
jgi:phosphatidylserine decarboxylase